MTIARFSTTVVFSAETTKDVDVSGTILDARKSIPSLYDSSGNVMAYLITAISPLELRITSETPLTGSYLLVAIGVAAPGVTLDTPSCTTQFSTPVVFAGETQLDVIVSSKIKDATLSVACLYDSAGNKLDYQLRAISPSSIRISSEAPLTGTFTLVVIGQPNTAPSPSDVAGAKLPPPSLSQYKTYGQLREKLESDLDLQDETFIVKNEMIGFLNEGVEEAESEILKIDEDYLCTSQPLPTVAGRSEYDYPANIYAFKVRGIIYANGSTIYDILRFRRKNRFENMALAQQSSQSDDYRWYHANDIPGYPKINLIPAARETSILPPVSPSFTPITVHYIRHMNRVPLLGQFILNWEFVSQATGLDFDLNRLLVTKTYATGDVVTISSPGSLPGGIVAGQSYYVIAGTGYIQLATTLQNAFLGVAIVFMSVGEGLLSISIAANQTIVDNTVIDIPEFSKFILQWAKCRCMLKDGDPRLDKEEAIRDQQRKQMVDTLTGAQADDQNEIEFDLSHYADLS